jgi:hypothetical protein
MPQQIRWQTKSNHLPVIVNTRYTSVETVFTDEYLHILQVDLA